MAEEDDHFEGPSTSEDRPQTAVRDSPQSRKVPGGFGIDDLDDLSPSKNEFEDSILANLQAHHQNNRIPSLDPASLPSLPPPGDSSLLYHSGDGGNESDAQLDAVDEEAMQRHLSNVESSFMPVASPIGMHGKKGADDTFLFDGAQPTARKISSVAEVSTPSKSQPEHINLPPSPPTPSGAYQTPAPHRDESVDESSLDEGDNTSSLETMSSSPTAAAAARTVSRAISMASGHQEDSSFGESQEDTETEPDVEATPRKSKNYSGSSDGRSTVRHVS